jgi:hypothetical protein
MLLVLEFGLMLVFLMGHPLLGSLSPFEGHPLLVWILGALMFCLFIWSLLDFLAFRVPRSVLGAARIKKRPKMQLLVGAALSGHPGYVHSALREAEGSPWQGPSTGLPLDAQLVQDNKRSLRRGLVWWLVGIAITIALALGSAFAAALVALVPVAFGASLAGLIVAVARVMTRWSQWFGTLG